MRKLLLLLPLLCLVLAACHKYEEWPDDALGNFDALCTIIDEHYCYLDEKNIDWPAVTAHYRSQITPATSQLELFNLCAEMLDTLRDGHVNLISRFNTSYYKKWWSDYPQDFNLRTLQQHYLNFDWGSTSGLIYKRLEADKPIGYIYVSSFNTVFSETNIDYVLALLADCDALIIDVRNNGGGMLSSAETLARRFISQPIIAGYMRHKTGPGHSDFSDPFPLEYKPAAAGRIRWEKPVAVLTNRSTYSSANDFVMVMKELPNVTIIGARTGGGGGMPFSAGLPNGWNVRFSACPITDARGASTENGIDPTPGCEMHAPDQELAAGHDAILDFAINTLSK